MPWKEGETFVVRYRLLGTETTIGARPLRFLGERSGYAAGWLAGDAVVASPILGDGRPLRAVTASKWLASELSYALVPWSGHGILMLIPRAGAHSIWLFWHDDGSFRGWYVNLEEPHVWHAGGCDTRDELLDLTCDRPREWRWKDEDELAEAVAAGLLSRRRADEVRVEGERVAGMVERWESPFADGWERWRPDPSWPTTALPAGWNAAPAGS